MDKNCNDMEAVRQNLLILGVTGTQLLALIRGCIQEFPD